MSEEKKVTQEDVESALRSLADRLTSPEVENSFAHHFFQPVRRQHFYFVHQYLDERLMGDADNSLADTLCGDSATQYLRELWLSVGSKVKADEDALIPADDLECFPFYIDHKHRAAIARFPEPERNCEAYLAAFVFSSDPKIRDLVSYYRFFILELGRDLDGSKRTVLCERNYGKHYTYKHECEPQREAFAQLIKREFFESSMDIYDPDDLALL